jgi:hypothetical protein
MSSNCEQMTFFKRQNTLDLCSPSYLNMKFFFVLASIHRLVDEKSFRSHFRFLADTLVPSMSSIFYYLAEQSCSELFYRFPFLNFISEALVSVLVLCILFAWPKHCNCFSCKYETYIHNRQFMWVRQASYLLQPLMDDLYSMKS